MATRNPRSRVTSAGNDYKFRQKVAPWYEGMARARKQINRFSLIALVTAIATLILEIAFNRGYVKNTKTQKHTKKNAKTHKKKKNVGKITCADFTQIAQP